MAITNYTNLQTAIENWAARTDLTTLLPDFIVLAETMFNHGDDEIGFPPIRTREMETAQSDTADSNGDITLQSDFLEMRRVRYQSDPDRRLEYASPDWLAEAYPTTAAGDPAFYTIVGSTLTIRPVGTGSTVEHTYYAKIPDIASNTTNWLLSKSPNTYLFGALYHLHVYTMAAEQAASYLALTKRSAGALIGADKMARAPSYTMRAHTVAW